ncbi:MAG: DciA family protein [Stellaceae bacterium]
MGRERKGHQAARVTGAPAESERRPESRQGGMRAAGIAASRLAAPIVARHGGGLLFRLKAEWAAVVGTELAATTWPEALSRDGALKLRVASTVALDLQHRAPLVIERINLFLGREAVARLVLVQGPLPLPAPPATSPPEPLAPEEAKALDIRLGDIADPGLRAALARLGRLVLAGERRGD